MVDNIVLYDVPVSNHGARVRIVIKSKNLGDRIKIKSPQEIGGLKSPEYLRLNPQGKMPLLVDNEDIIIPESDTICRYIIDKYASTGPSFIPQDLLLRSLNEQICRLHDIYITPIQACMYRAPGSVFSSFGTNRFAALDELKKQLVNTEQLLAHFDKLISRNKKGNFLCGEEISLADATLYPTMVFCTFMLPQFFNCKESEFMGPRLQEWWNFMSQEVSASREVGQEMMEALEGWKSSGRFQPIVSEVQQRQ